MKEISESALSLVFPIRIGDEELAEVSTLLKSGEDIPSELLAAVINLDNHEMCKLS